MANIRIETSFTRACSTLQQCSEILGVWVASFKSRGKRLLSVSNIGPLSELARGEAILFPIFDKCIGLCFYGSVGNHSIWLRRYALAEAAIKKLKGKYIKTVTENRISCRQGYASPHGHFLKVVQNLFLVNQNKPMPQWKELVSSIPPHGVRS